MKLLFVCLGVLVGVRTASAELPKWCGKTDYSELSEYELSGLKGDDPHRVVSTIAKTRCSTSPQIVQMHAQIDKARAAWGKKLGMNDDDWGDVLEFIDDKQGAYPRVDLSTKDLAQFTPMDQWQAIRYGLGREDAKTQALYIVDALDSRLTEVGRLAWLGKCLSDRVDHGNVGSLAICNADIEAWSWDKFTTQLRGDTVHARGTKMHLRFLALELNGKIADYKAAREKLFKADEEYKKVFAVAQKGRDEWQKTVGADTKALDVLLAMDSATLAGSRKMFADCGAKTTPLMQAAIAEVPAKTFTGMADERMDPFHGFAYKAGAVLVGFPKVFIAASAWAQCHSDRPAAKWLFSALASVPSQRGPRGAAASALLNEKFTFDDVKARPISVDKGDDDTPYYRSGGGLSSAGGSVDGTTVKGDVVSIKLGKTSMKQEQCLKSRFGKRVSRIRDDGSLEYELICDKWGVVTVDTTWGGEGFKVAKEWLPILKKGVVFSAYSAQGSDADDVLAIWPNKNASQPSMILGFKLKGAK